MANADGIIISENKRRKVEFETADSEKEVAIEAGLSKSVLGVAHLDYSHTYKTKEIV